MKRRREDDEKGEGEERGVMENSGRKGNG